MTNIERLFIIYGQPLFVCGLFQIVICHDYCVYAKERWFSVHGGRPKLRSKNEIKHS